MREERQQAQNGHDLELQFLRLVRHALREAMQSQIERPDPDEGGNQKNAHHHHQHIGPAPWGEVEGQMMRGHRMNLLAQRSLSKTEPGRFAGLVVRTVRTPGSDLLDLDQGNDIDRT